MIWSNVRTVYAKELRDALRDRRAVISMFVVPTLVMPLLLLTAGAVMAKIVKKAQDEASPVAIVGGAIVPLLTGVIADVSASLAVALVLPALCYAIIAAFGLYARRPA